MKSKFIKKRRGSAALGNVFSPDGSSATVTFNGHNYQLPVWGSGAFCPTFTVEEKPMTKTKQIEYFEYKLKQSQEEGRYKDQRINELNSEIYELKRPSRNPVIKTLKAISMIPIAPVLFVSAILAGLVDCGNDTFNRVFRNN